MAVQDVVKAWDTPDAPLHPTRGTDSYWESGQAWTTLLNAYIEEGSRVLDYGCGDGRVTKHLLKTYDAYGYDTGVHEREQFTAALGADRLITASSRRRFDAVVILAVLIHYDQVAGAEVLADAWARVADGGIIVVNVRLGERCDLGCFDVNVWEKGAVADVLGEADVLYSNGDLHIFRKP